MKTNYRKFLKVMNRVLYITSAAMLIAGAFLTVAAQPVVANSGANTPKPVDLCKNLEGDQETVPDGYVRETNGDCTLIPTGGGDPPPPADMQLNLSHIACAEAGSSQEGKVEVHFVLLNVADGVTPGALTFTVSVNGGAAGDLVIDAPTKHTGNVWHYSYFASVMGTYNVSAASVVVGATTVTLHNPGDYSTDHNQCGSTEPKCQYDDSILASDPLCVPCQFNSNLIASDPSCPAPCEFDGSISEVNELCVECDYVAGILESDPSCPAPCALNPAYPANDERCTVCPYNDKILIGDEDCPAACPQDDTYSVDDEACTVCPYNPNILIGNSECPGSCEFDSSQNPISEDDQACVECDYVPGILASDASCPAACPGHPEIPITSEVCEVCAYNPNLLKSDIDCPEACPYNKALPIGDPDCKPNKLYDPLKVEIDPYCNADGMMQWTVINPNTVNITMTYFTVDGVKHSGFSVVPGEHLLTATPLGTHVVVIHWGGSAQASLSYTIDTCPLTIPVTGNDLMIPVTGADNLGMGLGLAGISLTGLGLVLSALRRMLKF